MNFYRGMGYLLMGATLLTACGGGGGTSSSLVENVIPVAITDNYHVESLGSNSEINTTVSLGSTPKDVYLLLSNYATQDGNVQITKSNKSTQNLEMASYKSMSEKPHIIHAPAYVEIFRKNLHKMLFEPSTTQDARNKSLKITPQRKDFTNANKRFYLEQTQSSFTDATARKIVSNISTNLGTKTLNVWVSNDSFDSGLGCSKAKCVTQEMVNALADTFLKSGSDNDIYDWVTNIYGEEWGVHNENQLILQNDEITILLTDIDGDNSTTGGVLGYFFAKDNFLNSVIPGSNERVMLYADAVLFANGEGSWGIDDYWPREMLSTLAHELQHVIHFYQKDVLKNVSSDVWVNEMLSESVEDVIATKLKHTGPRGVEYTNGSAGTSRNEEGRYPLFNRSNTLSLTQWTNSLENYSHVNAFGAYLTRNYGGAKVLHDTLHSNHANEQSVTAAVNKAANGTDKTFNDLLREWGVAVLLSDIDNLPSNLPTYNTGDFTEDSYGSSTYGLGSINFFNYAPSPLLSSSAGEVQKQGNYYYRVGTGLMGNITISLSLNGETEATLITKESK